MKAKIFKKVLFVSILAALVVPTSSCGVVKIIRCMGKEKLNIFNWGAYVDPDVIKDFEKEFNVCVNYSTFDSNESAVLKIRMGEIYDVIIPSDYAIEQLVQENYLQEMDWTRIESFNPTTDLATELATMLLDLKLEANGFDFLKYAAPYFWGSFGIAYNTSKISEAVMIEKLEANQWNVLKTPNTIFGRTDMRVAHYDSSRDGALPALKSLGYSLNTTSQAEVNAAREWLYQQKTNVGSNLTYVMDDIIDDMAFSNKYDLALMYSGDATYAMQENEHVGFYMPTVGTNIWTDGMVIHKDAKNTDLAYDFINFMLGYDAAIANSLYVAYSAARNDAYQYLLHGDVAGSYEGEFGAYKDAYEMTPNLDSGDEMFRYNQASKTMIDNMWTLVKSYRP